MNLQDIKAFVAFAETGSVVRAADRIRLTQSATTRRIQRFEAALGSGPLLDRAVKPPALTPAGRRALERCRALLASLRELQGTGLEGDVPVGELRMGVAYGLGGLVLGRPLDALRRRLPGLALSVTSQWTATLAQQVRAGKLDCAVGVLVDGATAPPGVQAHTLHEDVLAVAAAPRLALPKPARGGLSLDQLRDQDWILAPHGCAFRALLERWSHAQGTELRVAAEVFETELRMSMVARGLGLGLVMRGYMKSARAGQRLRLVPMRDFAPRAALTMFSVRSAGTLQSAFDQLVSALSAPPHAARA